jgi:hypothetical protein
LSIINTKKPPAKKPNVGALMSGAQLLAESIGTNLGLQAEIAGAATLRINVIEIYKD